MLRYIHGVTRRVRWRSELSDDRRRRLDVTRPEDELTMFVACLEDGMRESIWIWNDITYCLELRRSELFG